MLRYDPRSFPLVAVTVDLVVLTVRGEELLVLLVERGGQPYIGNWALPGGFVKPAEDLDTAARRELGEETGLDRFPIHLEQLGTYGAPDRDPRMRVITVAYLALAPSLPDPTAGSDARAARWEPIDTVLSKGTALAFDHRQIVEDALERARNKLEYTTLAAAFCQPEFTVNELRRVYEIVWGQSIDPRNFHRKITGSFDFLIPTGGRTTRDGGRPASLYRCGRAPLLHPPLLRAGAERVRSA